MRVITSSSASGTNNLGGRNSTVISGWPSLSKVAIQSVGAHPTGMAIEVNGYAPSGW